jgi:hypothetical protein
MTMKETGEAILALGPSPEHRAAVARSFFGTLMGQAVALVLMVVAYVAAIAMLYRFGGDELRALQADLGPVWFWTLLLAPLGFIAVFQMLPTALRHRRERRLFPLSRADQPPPPGYFRLYPFGGNEAERFSRLDGAVERVKDWVQGTGASVLYLSGASGSGKSSLVAAGLAPALEADGWRVVQGRGLGRTYAELAERLESVSDPDDLAEQRKLDVYDRTMIVSQRLRERKVRGLLIVIDQFEEFLILEAEEERRAFAGLLARLAAEPIPGVKLLLVFREDYRALLFKQELPAYEPGRSAFELASFTRREAEAFLQGGPSRLDERGHQALFAGLDRIEGTPGLYRPITLNMAGLVLERTGAQLADDPGRLIERYLTGCLAAGKSRDFARQVLEAMITREGTKEPRSEADLAAASGLEAWQVRATLSDLQQDGLVRLLDAPRRIWEISHDFLARILARLLGRLRPRWFRRAALPVLGVATAGWLAVMLLAVPLYVQQRSDAAMRELLALGFNRVAPRVEGTALAWVGVSMEGALAFALRGAFAFALKGGEGSMVDEILSRAGTLFPRLTPPLSELDLSGQRGRTSWPFPGVSSQVMDRGLTDLSPLAGLPLRSLDLAATSVTDLSPLAGMPLEHLDLRDTDLTDLSRLAGMPLQTLDLRRTGVTDLSPLAGMPLQTLYLAETGVTDLSPLAGMPQRTLYLAETGVTDLSPLAGMPLRLLDLRRTGVTDLAPLEGMNVHLTGP